MAISLAAACRLYPILDWCERYFARNVKHRALECWRRQTAASLLRIPWQLMRVFPQFLIWVVFSAAAWAIVCGLLFVYAIVGITVMTRYIGSHDKSPHSFVTIVTICISMIFIVGLPKRIYFMWTKRSKYWARFDAACRAAYGWLDRISLKRLTSAAGCVVAELRDPHNYKAKYCLNTLCPVAVCAVITWLLHLWVDNPVWLGIAISNVMTILTTILLYATMALVHILWTNRQTIIRWCRALKIYIITPNADPKAQSQFHSCGPGPADRQFSASGGSRTTPAFPDAYADRQGGPSSLAT